MIRLVMLLLALTLFSGCMAVPYTYTQEVEGGDVLALRTGEEQVHRGRPNAFVDGLGHYLFSLPSKLILWNWH